MKILTTLLLLLVLNLNDLSDKPSNNNSVIKITILDKVTKETLTGVKSENTYSNFNGVIKTTPKDTLVLEFISYEKVIVSNLYCDTTIYMTNLNN